MNDLEEVEAQLRENHSLVLDIAAKELSKIRSKARKKIQDVDKRLFNISEDGEKFKEEIMPESTAQVKYSQKIYETVKETIQSIESPINDETITLSKTKIYSEEVRNALYHQDETLIKYVKLLKDSKYKNRVQTLSRSLQKLNKDLTSLEKFIQEEYIPNSEIETLGENIELILSNLQKYREEIQELILKEEEVSNLDVEIKKTHDIKTDLEEHEVKIEYNQIMELYVENQKEVDIKFSNIRKALRKYANAISKSKNQGDTSLIKDLVTDAARCLANQQSLGSIESLLREIQKLMDDASLNLKKDKREAALKDIELFLGGEIKTYWEKSREIFLKRNELENKLQELQLDKEIEKVDTTLAAIKRDRNRIIERNLRDIDRLKETLVKEIQEVNEKVVSHGISTNEIKFIPIELPNWSNPYL